MDLSKPSVLTRLKYEQAAEAYLRSLPKEHFMEATAQATQRKITLESFDLIHASRPDVQVFNELLVQYPKNKKIAQVVPDNMVVIHPTPIDADGSYDVIFQPAHPFLVLEYVSKHTTRKDYDDNMVRYERDLKVPYYLLFYPDSLDLNLFHRKRTRYASITANDAGRFAIPELDLEVALLDDWVRYWFRGELLPLPAEMLRELESTRRRLRVMTRRASAAEQTAENERQSRLAAEQELARLRAELEQLRRQRPTA